MKGEIETRLRAEDVDLESDEQVDRAIGAAVQEVLKEHKRRGQSVVVWQDGKVVTLAPEDIPVEA